MIRKLFNNIIFKFILNLTPTQRRTVLILVDSILLLFSLLATIFFNLYYLKRFEFIIFFKEIIILNLIAIPLYLKTGQYKSLSRYVGSQSLYELALRNFIITTIYGITKLFGFSFIEIFKFSILYWILLTFIGGFARFASRDFLLKFTAFPDEKIKKVAIYGTGPASAQLFASLRLSKNHKVVFFIDDNPLVWERYLYNIKIISPNELSSRSSLIDQVLIVSNFKSLKKRKEFLKLLEVLDLPVLEIPSITEIASRKNLIEYLRPVNIEDLLGRQSDDTINDLSLNIIKNKVVCVTGAGGSIGSELCRKISLLNPKLLIMYENNEANLYAINNEIKKMNLVKIKPILGCVGNKFLLKRIFKEHNVQIVFHSAAFKHVPIVQDNPVEGIRNNVLNTRIICEAALEEEINNFILISTDKAVRPTNVMGASKRVAELIVQSFAEENALRQKSDKSRKNVIFSMVRFGNVLGSSGSVVPLFQKQISEGGPITLTDKNIERFFMTIPEAAKLVIMSASMAVGGELFLLDMGTPVKIEYLAKQMIRLNGLKVKSENNPHGDVEIVITGLRSGEKLYEELLIDGKSEKTINPRIFKSREYSYNKEKLWKKLDEINDLEHNIDELEILKKIADLVPEWSDKRFN